MKPISQMFRLFRIHFVLMRYNLDEFILEIPWFYPFRFLSYFNPWHWILKNKLTRGERLRHALEDLGPIFIKAGQVLSTRRDFLPDDIAEELEKLQDRVTPFSGQIAKKIVEESLCLPIDSVFQEFELTALASASVAQVHAAKLLNGKSVVVKVLRPGIQKIIERDIDLLMTLANIADRYWPDARRFKPKEMVDEISHTLHDELDLLREGANASQLRRNFQHSEMLYIPEIYWTYSRASVLVMERIEGIQIHNVPALKACGINMKKLAERGVEIFFTQVFRDSFFHADMHPGNIFVCTKNLENPKYIAVDFGIVGSLNTKDQRYLAENMLAFFKRDYQRVAELHIASGWLPPDTRIDQFEGAIRAVCEPIFERPLKDISFGQLLLRLFQAARRFNMNIQPQLILLQKTLLNVEGVGRQIYPDLDLWTTAAPFLERWLKKQVGAKAFLRRVRENIPYWSEKFPEIPGLIYDVLNQTREQNEQIRFNQQMILLKREKKPKWRYFWLGAGSAVLVMGLMMWGK
ncbi:MAG TPA: ubiquinone biosynthesis regulatory protein kinase UbiB [Gammaproteobacteria bacterium]|nr:ubiquinone biosynthesis regulatory protein kinase UbiB [Gammaproteobacteria bacterium]